MIFLINVGDPFFAENRTETLRLFETVRKGAGEDGGNTGEKNGKGGESHIKGSFTPFFILREMRY